MLDLKQSATLTIGTLFLRDVLTENTSCLLFMESFTTAIILPKSCCYFYDSHSRKEKGLGLVDRTSVLRKFNDHYEIEKYIQVAYLEYRERQQAYFQIQFIEVTEGSTEKADIYSHYARNLRLRHDREHSADINKRQRVYSSKLQGSPSTS